MSFNIILVNRCVFDTMSYILSLKNSTNYFRGLHYILYEYYSVDPFLKQFINYLRNLI